MRRGACKGTSYSTLKECQMFHLLPPSQRFCENHSSQMKWKHTDLLKEEHTYPAPLTRLHNLRLRLTLKVFMLTNMTQPHPPAVPSVHRSYLTAAFAHVSPSSQNALSPCLPSKLLFILQDPSQASPSMCSRLWSFPHGSRTDHRIFCIPTDLEREFVAYSSHLPRLHLEPSGPQI